MPAQVVTRNPEETIAKDAALLLLELEYWFGYGAKHYESALNIFGSYLGVDDVIFKVRNAPPRGPSLAPLGDSVQ